MPRVTQTVKLWHSERRRVTASPILKARVDPELARQVEAWAKDHGTDVSETIRVALRKLVEHEKRERKARETLKRFDELAKTGIYDPPKRPFKASGGWR